MSIAPLNSISQSYHMDLQSEIEVLRGGGDYQAAGLYLEGWLLQTPIEEAALIKICDYILDISEHLPEGKRVDLFQKTCSALTSFPKLKERQVLFLTSHGDLFLKEFTKTNLAIAIRCFATAMRIEPNSDLQSKISQVILSKYFSFENHMNYFQYLLHQAGGRGEVLQFENLIDSIENLHQKFSSQPDDIQKYYEAASNTYNGLNDNTKRQFFSLLPKINEGRSFSRGLDGRESLTTMHHSQFNQLRAQFDNSKSLREISREYLDFLRQLFEDAMFIIGTPPCRYEIRAMGSAAREEILPFSDFEYFILIEDEKHRPYFKQLADIFELFVLSFGETSIKHDGFFDFGQQAGFEIDVQANPASDESLIGTPQALFNTNNVRNDDDLKALKSRLGSIPLHSNGNFTISLKPFAEIGERLLAMRRREFNELKIQRSDICDFKHEVMEPLFHFIGDLGICFGVEATNTSDIVARLPCFNEKSRTLIQDSVRDIYRIRVRLQNTYQRRLEIASFELLYPTEIKSHSIAAYLVIPSLYSMKIGEESDILEVALNNPNIKTKQLAIEVLDGSSLEIYLHYFQRLTGSDQVLFVKCLESSDQILASTLKRFPSLVNEKSFLKLLGSIDLNTQKGEIIGIWEAGAAMGIPIAKRVFVWIYGIETSNLKPDLGEINQEVIARSFYILGKHYYDIRDIEKSIHYLSVADSILRKAISKKRRSPENHVMSYVIGVGRALRTKDAMFAKTQFLLGVCAQYAGKYQIAVEQYELALSDLEQYSNSQDILALKVDLFRGFGFCRFSEQHPNVALKEYETALELQKRIKSQNSDEQRLKLASLLVEKGHTLRNLDRNTDAIESFEEALEIQREILGDRYPDVLETERLINPPVDQLEDQTETLDSYEANAEPNAGENEEIPAMTKSPFLDEIKKMSCEKMDFRILAAYVGVLAVIFFITLSNDREDG